MFNDNKNLNIIKSINNEDSTKLDSLLAEAELAVQIAALESAIASSESAIAISKSIVASSESAIAASESVFEENIKDVTETEEIKLI